MFAQIHLAITAGLAPLCRPLSSLSPDLSTLLQA